MVVIYMINEKRKYVGREDLDTDGIDRGKLIKGLMEISQKESLSYNYPTKEESEQIFKGMENREDLKQIFSFFINKIEKAKDQNLKEQIKIHTHNIYLNRDESIVDSNISEFREAIKNSEIEPQKKERILESFNKYTSEQKEYYNLSKNFKGIEDLDINSVNREIIESKFKESVIPMVEKQLPPVSAPIEKIRNRSESSIRITNWIKDKMDKDKPSDENKRKTLDTNKLKR